ncbi:MAG: WbuC family cupin fold metalloprotein [Alistipes sp.]
MLKIDKRLLQELLVKAESADRNRTNFDLRTSADDTSQRMLNALIPGTIVPIHRHEDTTETVICLCGKLDEIIYDEHIAEDGQMVYKECQRIRLCPSQGDYGCQVPKGAWHTVEVLEPSVIFEAKDGAYK